MKKIKNTKGTEKQKIIAWARNMWPSDYPRGSPGIMNRRKAANTARKLPMWMDARPGMCRMLDLVFL